MDEKLQNTENTPVPEEEEGIIITIDDDYIGPDAEEAEQEILSEISARESHIGEYVPPKEGFFKALGSFWYRNKSLIIIAAIGIFAVLYLAITSIPNKYDLTAAIYVSYTDFASTISVELDDEFRDYCQDWDNNGKVSVYISEYNINSDNGAASIVDYDSLIEHINGKPLSMLWVVDKDLFQLICNASGEDYFESFEGAPLWMEIKHNELINQCVENGECPRLGICLVRMTDEMSKDDSLRKSYDNAKLMLANLREAHPEMFVPAE